MADTTGIEWCDSTFNPWIGCTRVSPACDDCYAARSTPARTMGVVWGPGEPRRRTSTANWKQPEQWQRKAAEFHAAHGRRRRVFCASLADVFDNEVASEWRDDLFRLIEATPDLDWLLVTKRIGNVQHMVWPRWMQAGFPANVWIGITVVNQPEYDRDIGKLLRLPAAVHFLSIEPMLSAIDMRMGGASMPDYSEHRPLARLGWVICGGESGLKARPMHPEWVARLRNQCADARVPFLFKQWGEWMPESAMSFQQRMRDCGQYECLFTKLDGGTHWIDPDDHAPFDAADVRMVKLGKKAAGRLLDGRAHDGFPGAA